MLPPGSAWKNRGGRGARLLRRSSAGSRKVNISSAIFDRSAPDLASCPDESLPEFAFIGRSNVGKSSLLNLLSGRRDLARVSPMPGFTKLINIFTVNRTWRLVDLPGYGFAQMARKDKARFNLAVADYLQHRANLCCVFALVDSTLPPQAIDLEFVAWLAGHSIPFVLVFTKTDRLAPAKAQANIAAFTDRISGWFEKMPEIFTSSATARQGRKELLGVIEEALAEAGSMNPEPDAVTPAGNQAAVARKKPGGDARRGRPNPARPW